MNSDLFIQEIAQYVKKYASSFGIKVHSPIIAQAILESATGTSELAINAHNYFGLKYKPNRCTTHCGDYYKVGSEQNLDGLYVSSVMRWFKFDSVENCVKGYFEFINIARYSNLKGITSPTEYLEKIKADGYATSINYVSNLLRVIEKYDLTKYDIISEDKTMEIKQCLLTKNRCYKTNKKIKPTQIVVHSTGANNPNLKRYVQPDDGLLGTNTNKNDWNRDTVSVCVHAFIGKDKNGKVCCYQTLPYDIRPWGCGRGKKGSYNNNAIQFEICEDSLTNKQYFDEAFGLAIDYCVYLCDKYGIKPNNIVSHQEAYKQGYASNHADCDHWLIKFGKNMDWFRSEVKTRLGNNVVEVIKVNPYKEPTSVVKYNVATQYVALESVKWMQWQLNQFGYNLVVDGKFGKGTLSALKDFQSKHNLDVDGMCGSLTRKELKKN